MRERSGLEGLVVTAACMAALGCAAEPARPPVMASVAEREAFYQANRLELHDDFWSTTWSRADGEYIRGQLSELAAQYPEAEKLYDRATTRGAVIGAIGGAGGGAIGFTLGYNLAAPEERRWSTAGQIAGYSVGGGLIVISIIVAAAWHNPDLDFARVYNRALRLELGLLPEPERAGDGASLVPRALPSGGVGWTF